MFEHKHVFPKRVVHPCMIYTVILSFPRSGNTWFRYCYEVITGIPTWGDYAGDFETVFQNKRYSGRHTGAILDTPILMQVYNFDPDQFFKDLGFPMWEYLLRYPSFKRHSIEKDEFLDEAFTPGDGPTLGDRLIYIMRNPYDAILRHLSSEMRHHEHPTIPPEGRIDDLIELYISSLATYDNWHPEKRKMLFYKDLLTPSPSFLRFWRAHPDTNLQQMEFFVRDWDIHTKISLNLYETKDKEASGVGSFRLQNRKNTLIVDKKNFYDKFRSKNEYLYKKYIEGRWNV